MMPVHMSGAGNRFLVATSVDEGPWSDEQIRSLLVQHPRPDRYAVEGVLLVHPWLDPDQPIIIDFFNPDGSTGMMCGNGTRCAVRYAVDQWPHDTSKPLTLRVNHLPFIAHVHADASIELQLPAPREEQWLPVGSLNDVDVDATYVDVQSDHVVIDGPRDASRPVVHTLRFHPAFPRGVNVNMVDVQSPNVLHLATFERGVEAVTGACGTGALSTAIALWRQGRCSDTVDILPPSGRPLHVTIEHDHDRITGLRLRGDALYDTFDTPSSPKHP